MNYSNRIFIYGPVGLLLLVIILYSVFWRVEADTLSAKLDRANGGEIVPGITFAFADKTVGGYPFRLDAVLSGVTLAHRGPEGETAWRAEKMALHAMTYGPPHYLLEASGLQSIARPPEKRGEVPRVIYLTPAIARASAIMTDGRLARFDLDLLNPQGKDATQGADPNRTFAAARAQFHLLRRADDGVDVALKIEGGKLGEAFKPAFGTDVPLIDMRGKLLQSQTLDGLEAGRESFFDAIEHWREAGGTLAVDSLTLAWGPMKTGLQGAVGLDAEHRPSGVLLGTFDSKELVSSILRGITAPAMGELILSLEFKDGDIKAGASSAALGTAH